MGFVRGIDEFWWFYGCGCILLNFGFLFIAVASYLPDVYLISVWFDVSLTFDFVMVDLGSFCCLWFLSSCNAGFNSYAFAELLWVLVVDLSLVACWA